METIFLCLFVNTNTLRLTVASITNNIMHHIFFVGHENMHELIASSLEEREPMVINTNKGSKI